jgi:hypothetical protein
VSPREQVQIIQLLQDWLYFSTDQSACSCERCLASLLQRKREFLAFQGERASHKEPESHGQRRS